MTAADRRILELAEKWENGTITEAEKIEFSQWFEQDINNSLLIPAGFAKSESEIKNRLLKNIRRRQRATGKLFYLDNAFINRAAVACVLFLVVGVLFYEHMHKGMQSPVQQTAHNQTGDKEPRVETSNAYLVLGDGTKISLDTVSNGTIAKERNTTIIKTGKDQIAYSALKGRATATQNTLVTGKGGQYMIVLPDGSNVWLDASSSLRFPSTFEASERVVELTGEAYFEVVHNRKQPFKVKVKNVDIVDLGTHFNIMAYPDEKVIKTTLLEGAVSINQMDKSLRLKPGQQAWVGRSGEINVTDNVNLNEVIGWRDGLFSFENMDIESIMRQLQRWYDIEVDYQTKIPTLFNGTISKYSGLEKAFKMLELTGAVRFQRNGNRVIVRD